MAINVPAVSFESIVDHLPFCLLLKDREGRRVYANKTYLDMHCCQLEQMLGKSDADLFSSDLAEKYRADDQHVMQSGEVIHRLEEHLLVDGQRKWVESFKAPWLDEDNNILGIELLFFDATEQKKTQNELKYERALLHALLDNIPDSIYFKDRDSRFLRISRSMAEKFGLKDPKLFLGKTDADIFTVEHAQQARADELKIIETSEPIVSKIERETWPNREDTWCSTTKMPLINDSNEIVGTFGISRDITDIKKIQDSLEAATEAAERANRSKSEFLANMSHEIRTPMNGIIGMAELLSDTPLDTQQRGFVDMVQQSAQSLLRLLNDILDFSKIEAGKLDLELISTDIRRCIETTMRGLGLRAAQKNLELAVRIDPRIPTMALCDCGRLQQVIINLVGNAIKFTDSGEVVLDAQLASGPPTEPEITIHFSVRDTGIGISPQQQKSIFAAFSQADASTTRKYGGTGLGLAISSQLVDLMGGKIWVESSLGHGTTFHFTAKLGAVDATQQKDKTRLVEHAGKSVLVVDDNQTNRVILRETLTKVGFAVITAENGAQAIAHFKSRCAESRPFDLIITDHMMPSMDGEQLIENLKRVDECSMPPILLYTSGTKPDWHDQLPNSVAVLNKPALQSELIDTINELLGIDADDEQTDRAKRKPTSSISLNLLLAEDGAVNQAVALGLLAREGHRVQVVENGMAAVEAWQTGQFDAILMDIQMPIMDGIQATAKIRHLELEQHTDEGSPRIPIIALTAAAMKGDRDRCIEAGMDDYLDKPIVVENLNAVLQRVIVSKTSGEFVTARIVEQNNESSSNELLATASNGSAAIASEEPRNGSIGKKNSSPVLDPTAPLRRLRCKPQQLRVLLETLASESEQRIEQLSSGFESGNIELVTRAAHSLRSAAQLFDAKEVVNAAGKIEESSRLGDLTTAVTQFDNLCVAAGAVDLAIKEWLENDKN